MEIKATDYYINYDVNTSAITCIGSLRLNGMQEYTPIVDLLNTVVEQAPPFIALDLRQLEFLNSSGINVISKFVIRIRQKGQTKMLVRGSKQVSWQSKSLRNLQRLMPSLQLEWE